MRALRSVQIALVVVMCSFAAIAWACLWDSDTLRHEAQGMPGVVEAVTGFFPVYPDAYYERRIEIARDRLAENPDRLGSYDDIAVSLDRLGDSAGAIKAIGPKLAVIERLGDGAGDHLYRYHANLGTFHAHKWVRAGADGTDMADLELAREHIAKAIEINPDAHFGREYVQLAAIEWLLDPEAGRESARWYGKYPTLASRLLTEEELNGFEIDVPQKTIDGLVGLVVLGNAWESIDVIAALGVCMQQEFHSSLAAICGMRIDELRQDGKLSLHFRAFRDPEAERIRGDAFNVTIGGRDLEAVRGYYRDASAAAGQYRLEYAAFVSEQLDRGMHPDTHTDFFVGAPAVVLPEMPNGLFGHAGNARDQFLVGVTLYTIMGTIVAIPVVVFVVIIYIKRARRKKLTHQPAGGL